MLGLYLSYIKDAPWTVLHLPSMRPNKQTTMVQRNVHICLLDLLLCFFNCIWLLMTWSYSSATAGHESNMWNLTSLCERRVIITWLKDMYYVFIYRNYVINIIDQLDRMFDNLFRLVVKKTSNLEITDHLWREYTVDRYNDVIRARWQFKSPPSRLFTQPLIQAQIKDNIRAPRYWPNCGEFTGDHISCKIHFHVIWSGCLHVHRF